MKKVKKMKVIKDVIGKAKGMVVAVLITMVPELKPVQTFALSYMLNGEHVDSALKVMGWVLADADPAKIKADIATLPLATIEEGFYTADSMIALFTQLKEDHLPVIVEISKDLAGFKMFRTILSKITDGYEYIS